MIQEGYFGSNKADGDKLKVDLFPKDKDSSHKRANSTSSFRIKNNGDED